MEPAPAHPQSAPGNRPGSMTFDLKSSPTL